MGRGWKVEGMVRDVIGKNEDCKKMKAYLNNLITQLQPNFRRGEGPAFKEGAIRELSEVVEGGERLDHALLLDE